MTLSGMNMLSDDSEDEIENIDPYRRKYQLLSERCEVLQQDNERLAFRTQETRKKRNKQRKLRKAILDRLDQHGDAWRTAPLMIPDPTVRTVVKTEKISPKTSLNKSSGQKVKAQSATASGSDKISPGKAPKSSGGGSKRKPAAPKVERTERDLNSAAPKRPTNPFFVFCTEQQPLLSEQLAGQRPGEPEPSKAELNKHLAAQWNMLNADERKIYYNLFEQSKEQYIQDIAIYKRERQSPAMNPS